MSIILLLIATLYYPGGLQYDKNFIGYDWKNNYLSNLFTPKEVNGSANASRFWAISGRFLLRIGTGLFFIDFSEKIPKKGAAKIIKYFGAGAMLFAFLAVVPYHDTMILIASTLDLVSIFYMTIFIVKSRLHLLKIFSSVCLYSCNYVYYTRKYLDFLPVSQKATLLITISWIMTLHYFAAPADFQSEEQVTLK